MWTALLQPERTACYINVPTVSRFCEELFSSCHHLHSSDESLRCHKSKTGQMMYYKSKKLNNNLGV